MGSRLLRSATLLLILVSGAVQAESAPQFPELTGRVVDKAGMLDQQTEAMLSQMSEAHEQASGEQVVVVTVPNLQGYPIEDYGYQLGRYWGIGQEGEDNGALLLVSEEDRKIRIEVGYGLEGRLTDAQASTIINGIITPAFRQGDFAGGVRAGTAAMIQVLGGEPLAQPANRGGVAPAAERPNAPLASVFFLIMMAVVYFLGGGSGRGRGRGRGGAAFLGGALLGAGLGRGGGGFGGGGFGGGGGGFGGGGASGGW
ncbi:TPM domain-containing protein [Hydrocarboniclastica marina]|uniref:Methanol dehydrogenase n=1 Tax=Hydrocarboniclastica marina TaxID=2259620 RepID=A0A4P7XEE2_9ALTE|nr:TPM domain-containing protein [Hydrocarboniclastica marina]QCF25226.1 methanol dehydrogenase [Hydrocarboniclastica marina]